MAPLTAPAMQKAAISVRTAAGQTIQVSRQQHAPCLPSMMGTPLSSSAERLSQIPFCGTGLLSKQGKKADYCSTFWRSTDWDALQWSAVMAFKISKRGVVQVHMAGGQPAQSLSGMLQGVMPMILQMQQQLLG